MPGVVVRGLWILFFFWILVVIISHPEATANAWHNFWHVFFTSAGAK